MSELKTDKPKLTWIDIAITVTLLASIVGLAAWLLSSRFSYFAAPASSFGLVNLLKKPKDEDSTQAEVTETTRDRESVITPSTSDRFDGTDISMPPSSLDTALVIPEPPLGSNPVGQSLDPSIDPFDSSLLEVHLPLDEVFPSVNEAIDATSPDAQSDPLGDLVSPEMSDQPDPLRDLVPTVSSEPSEPSDQTGLPHDWIPTPPSPTPPSSTPIATPAPIDQPIRYLSERYDQGERNFQNFDLRNIDLNYRLLRLVGADLRELKAERANLQQVDLTQANLGRADLQYAKLDGANLSYTNLAAANLSGASLRGVNLREAKLMDAQLAIADLSYADLSGADLSGADLTDTNLYRARLDGAKLPDTLPRS